LKEKTIRSFINSQALQFAYASNFTGTKQDISLITMENALFCKQILDIQKTGSYQAVWCLKLLKKIAETPPPPLFFYDEVARYSRKKDTMKNMVLKPVIFQF